MIVSSCIEEMSKVLLVETEKLYFNLLKELDGDSIQFRCLSPEKSLHTFIDYLQESHELTSIVDIEQVALVEAMLTVRIRTDCALYNSNVFLF